MPAEGKLSIETQKLLSFLTWDWQPIDYVIEQAIDGVPPGKALRKYQARRDYEAKTNPNAAGRRVKRELTEDEQILSGAKDILRGALYSQAKTERVEMQVDSEGVRMVRFKERRLADADGCCVACRRPFEQATVKVGEPPSRKVVYPHFPAWLAEAERKGAS